MTTTSDTPTDPAVDGPRDRTRPLGQAILRLPPTVIFGLGTLAQLGAVTAERGHSALLCSDPGVAATPMFARALATLRSAGVRVTRFTDVAADVPVETIAACARRATGEEVDVVVGLGGGSAIDTAKLAALVLAHPGELSDRYGENRVPGPCLPVIAVPTTAGTGSEVTPVAVLHDADQRMKVGISSRFLIPVTAICDPETTVSCPPLTTAHAGIDALTHAIEAYTSAVRDTTWSDYPGPVFRGKNPLSDLFALSAIETIHRSLERAIDRGDDLDARTDMLYGSLCAGCGFSQAGTAAAHALQYPIGALTGTPHGLGVGVLLPYVLDAIRIPAQSALARIGRAIGLDDGDGDPARAAAATVREMARLVRACELPTSLAQIGIREAQINSIADDALTITRLLENSPRAMNHDLLVDILHAAWAGEPVAVDA